MDGKFHFVYITTNLINKMQYVGDHSTNNINDKYLGSGRPYFQRALKEYGKENFKREILEFFLTKQEAFDAQEKYIIQYNTLVPNGYNLSPKGGHHCPNSWSEESKKKLSISKKGKRLGISPINKGKTYLEYFIEIYGDEEGLKIRNEYIESISKSLTGKKQSKETIEKRNNANTGKKRTSQQIENIKNGKAKAKELKDLENPKTNIIKNKKESKPKITRKGKTMLQYLTELYGEEEALNRYEKYIIKISKSLTGKKRSEESKKRQSKSTKGVPASEEAKENMRKAKVKQKEKRNGVKEIRKPLSKETKEKISKSLLGHEVSKESIEKTKVTKLKNRLKKEEKEEK